MFEVCLMTSPSLATSTRLVTHAHAVKLCMKGRKGLANIALVMIACQLTNQISLKRFVPILFMTLAVAN